MPVFIFFNWAMFNWLLRPNKKRSGVFLGTAIVGAFYLYSYLWQVVVITIVFVELYLLMARQWSRFFNLLKISSLALALAAPVILSTFKASLLTGYWENMQRVGFVATHLPPIEAYYYGRWLIVAGLIWTIFFVKQLKDKTVTAWYFLIVSAAIFLALVSNVITGKIFDRYSREQIRNYLFALMFGLEIYYFVILKLWRERFILPL